MVTADDTGTDWAATAEQLRHRATQNAIVRSYGIMPSSRPEDDELDRAAAVGLRRLAQLDTAIGDPEELRGWVDEYNGIMLRNFAAHILAAVLGSGEQPEGPTT